MPEDLDLNINAPVLQLGRLLVMAHVLAAPTSYEDKCYRLANLQEGSVEKP